MAATIIPGQGDSTHQLLLVAIPHYKDDHNDDDTDDACQDKQDNHDGCHDNSKVDLNLRRSGGLTYIGGIEEKIELCTQI